VATPLPTRRHFQYKRPRYAYVLDVTYPEGSFTFGWAPEDWVAPYQFGPNDELDGFRWPSLRPYFSLSGATKRANLLRKYGAEVTVIRSLPMEWPA
jgi:hypothetical protein